MTADVTLCKSSLFALTADSWFHRYDLDSGTLLERIFLSSKFKFRCFFIFILYVINIWLCCVDSFRVFLLFSSLSICCMYHYSL